MNAYPFTLFKRSNRPFYFVSFKDVDGRLLNPISTKKRNEKEAMQIAFAWLRDGVPKKQNVVTVQDLSFKDMIRKIKTLEEAESIMTELKRLGFVKNYILSDTPQAQDFISFLKNFWDWDTSPYIREKLRKSHGIHRRHCRIQERSIALYWESFFQGRYMGEINATDIDKFISFMGEMDISGSRKNRVILAGTKPLRWAFTKGMIAIDPTRGHTLFSSEQRKRHILTPSAAAAAFRVEWADGRAKLANMLASVTGMRSGEVQALRVQDIGSDCLYVCGSWNKTDGLKLPKNNKTRTVEIPFPGLIHALIELAKQNPWGVSPDSFVFWTPVKKDVPMHGRAFVVGLRDALLKIGFTEGETVKYLFHGWRHFFTAYMIGKLDKKLLKGETGHLTDVMLNLYGDHEIVGDRELIKAKKIETFAGLLPDNELLLEYKVVTKTAVA